MKTSTTRAAALVGLAALASSLPTAAQHAHQAPLPPAATELHPGLGDYHFPITTANPDAQVYFDQGIRLLYGFNHDEAARYFRRAAELDPQAPMPYWGVALSIGPELQRHGRRRRARASDVRRRQERRAARRQRERARARLHRGARASAIRRRSLHPTGSASIATTAKRCARWRRSIPTTSTRGRCSPRAS